MSTKDRKQREKENRRELILSAAEEIMLDKGLYGLSVDQIATHTELAKGTIYLYFKSKEEILSALTIKARKLLLNEFEKIDRKDIAPIEKLKAIIRANYTFNKKNPLYYDLVSLYEANHLLVETEEMYESSGAIISLVSGIITEAKRNGSVHPGIHPLYFTMILWGTTVGVLQLIKVRGSVLKDKHNLSEQKLLSAFIAFMENGIKK